MQRVSDAASIEFRQAWNIYIASFPPDERRSLSQQKGVMKDPLYSLNVFKEGDEAIAFISSWDIGDWQFIEHFAVSEKCRAKGLGTKILQEYLGSQQQVVLEVELPETGTAQKRILFYEKLGLKLNTYPYEQPPYGKMKKPVKLYLMTYPNKLDNAGFKMVKSLLYRIVYMHN